MKVEPIDQGQHYRPLADRICEVASAVGMEVYKVQATGVRLIEVQLLHPVTRDLHKWNGVVQGRTDDDVVKQFTLWVASVR